MLSLVKVLVGASGATMMIMTRAKKGRSVDGRASRGVTNRQINWTETKTQTGEV